MTDGLTSPEGGGSAFALGKYIVLAELGRGGMAEVFLALSRGPNGFNKLVVLKLLRPHLAEDEAFLAMFLAEAKLAARLNHANVVQTYEVGVEGGRHCIVMEYLEGRSFAEIEGATKRDPIPVSLGVRIVADALAGLHHAHELCDVDGRPLHLIHRDVSPHNVFVTYDGQVKLLDFGIAKAADDGQKTKTGVFKGKIRYTAPERLGGDESDRRSDVFSVGVMLWQILTRRRLWAGLNELTVMQHLATKTPIASPRSVNPDVPEKLDAICMRALATDPNGRFATAAEMEDALEEFLAGESVGATNRALAKFMGETFGETRARFQRTVDEQIRAAMTAPLDDEPSASVARVRADALPLLALPTPDSLSSIPAPMATSASRVRVGVGVGLDPSSRPPGLAASVSPVQAPRSRPRGALVAAFAFSVGALAIAGLVWRAGSEARGTAAGLGAPAPGSWVSAPPPAPSAPIAPSVTPAIDVTTPSIAIDAAVPAPHRAPTQSAPTRALPSPARAHSAPADTHAPPPPQAPKVEPPKREVDCSSPYFIDDQGMKRIRMECL